MNKNEFRNRFEIALLNLHERSEDQLDDLAANAAAVRAGFPKKGVAFVDRVVITALLSARQLPIGVSEVKYIRDIAYLAYSPWWQRMLDDSTDWIFNPAVVQDAFA